jgi:uncharacterized protein (AIM24 family)
MNCKIVGYEFKTLEVKLSPGEDFYGEAGSMVYIEDGISRSLNVVKTKKSFARYFSGESIFLIHYKNNSFCEKKLLLSSGLLGLHPIKLIKGYPILLRCGGYVASTNNVDIGLSIRGYGLKAGMSFQRIEGDATIFVETAGTPIEIDLKIGEGIEVDENHIIALSGFDPNSISSKWQVRNIFHGEGLSTSFIEGPGRVIISPSPLSNTKDPVQNLWGCLWTLMFFAIIMGISFISVLMR